MKTSNKHNNSIFLLFWSMPSCSMIKVYKRNSDLLAQAMRNKSSVEIITQGNKVIKLIKIGIESGKFFGLKTKKGKLKKRLLNINDIKLVSLL